MSKPETLAKRYVAWLIESGHTSAVLYDETGLHPSSRIMKFNRAFQSLIAKHELSITVTRKPQ